jgi:hypothetical protein
MRNTVIAIAVIAATTVSAIGPSHASTRNFFTPTVGGDRLSFCVTNQQTCGKPIADAWCRAVGFEEALNYQRDQRINAQPIVARYADTGGICTGADCKSFRQIKCWRES